MELKQSIKYGIGTAIADCLLVIEAIINLQTGKFTWIEFYTLIVLSVILAIFTVVLLKRRTRKKAHKMNQQKTETGESADSIDV